jgi:hypothetical protein
MQTGHVLDASLPPRSFIPSLVPVSIAADLDSFPRGNLFRSILHAESGKGVGPSLHTTEFLRWVLHATCGIAAVHSGAACVAAGAIPECAAMAIRVKFVTPLVRNTDELGIVTKVREIAPSDRLLHHASAALLALIRPKCDSALFPYESFNLMDSHKCQFRFFPFVSRDLILASFPRFCNRVPFISDSWVFRFLGSR